LLSALQARFDGAVAMEQVEQYVKIILPIFIGLTLIDSVQKLKQMAWVLLFCCSYLAWRFNEDYYWNIQDFSPEEWVFASMDSNGIALTMVATAALAFFMALNPPDCWKIPKGVLRLICLFTVATSTHVVLFSMSRGGMVALILTGFLAFLILPKRPLYLAMFAAAVLIGLRLAGASVQERFAQVFEHEKDASAVSRTVLWGQCWELMLQYPLLGLGPDNWFKWARGYWGTEKAAHTLWLHVGAEMGFPGLFFLASYYFLSTGRLLRYCFEKTPTLDPWLHTLARLVVASVVGFAIAAQFLSVQGVELPYYIALLGAGMLKIESAQASLAAAGAWASPAPYPVPYQYPVRVPMPAGPRSPYPVRS
jgi:O-antigen ligase